MAGAPSAVKKYFWDTDFDSLDIKKHKRFILERLLEMGDDKAMEWMQRNFSKKEILHTLKHSRRISCKSLNFWNLILKK